MPTSAHRLDPVVPSPSTVSSAERPADVVEAVGSRVMRIRLRRSAAWRSPARCRPLVVRLAAHSVYGVAMGDCSRVVAIAISIAAGLRAWTAGKRAREAMAGTASLEVSLQRIADIMQESMTLSAHAEALAPVDRGSGVHRRVRVRSLATAFAM
jgi:hypothetical protein